jgi:hypothetical protein
MDHDADLRHLAEIIKAAVSKDVRPPRYLASKQKDLHIFMWACRCWIKFKGPEALPETAPLDDVWELSWIFHWDWLEEGSCSHEHGSDGRRFVSPLSSRITRPPIMDRIYARQEGAEPIRMVLPTKTKRAPPRQKSLLNETGLTRREIKAQHDAVVDQIIEASAQKA